MARRSLNLVLDFDGTITTQDTIGLLADIGLQIQQQRRGSDLSVAWQQVLRNYDRDHVDHIAAYEPPASERLTLSNELAYLRGLKEVELRSVRRVEQSGIFRGISTSDLFMAGERAWAEGRLKLRYGFAELMDSAKQNGWSVSVLSVNWSRSFIKGVLSPYNFDVVANEIELDGSISGPDVLGSSLQNTIMTTCDDKLRALRALVSRQGIESTGGLVYFGDSTTDIECLLETRGVVISTNSESSLMNTLRRVGHHVPRIEGYRGSSSIVWASSFEEVLQNRFLSAYERDEQDY
ncbi:UPF0655 protein [Colletotrichum sojae]|uniref:UPF0655 protein n=1 Tax=Colletotrichum sojae TaxID=2175907 RepID=A0A8H6JDA1_9PEZI|nr:UPF0655 protein [Colletotrichum sojae]